MSKNFKASDITTLRRLYVIYVHPKLEYNTPTWSPYLIKDINKLESVQRRYTRLICNHCNIANTCYRERLVKFNIKYLEYRRLEFDLITLFKLVNGETTINFDNFYKSYEKNYLLIGNNKKLHANITLTIFNGTLIFSIVQ